MVSLQEGLEGLKILHISDLHVDPLYSEGSESVCDKPICCQIINGPGLIEPAGPFGSYKACDTPWRAVEETYEHIAAHHPVRVNQFNIIGLFFIQKIK
jgi:sphingomyelin phosphodiesterase